MNLTCGHAWPAVAIILMGTCGDYMALCQELGFSVGSVAVRLRTKRIIVAIGD